MTRTLGVFGGSFDPPHVGHVLLAAYALSVGPLDGLLIVPTFVHPFGKALAPYAHRVAMCERAFGLLRGATLSRLEEELGGPSYTVRTLEALTDAMPGTSFRLVVGADVIADVARWRDFERVSSLAPPFVVGRGGHVRPFGIEPLDLPAVSSTEVRARCARGEGFEGLVPREVAAYVETHGLYRA
jgi:nicotinate-nucleotide adenylyltransferase